MRQAILDDMLDSGRKGNLNSLEQVMMMMMIMLFCCNVQIKLIIIVKTVLCNTIIHGETHPGFPYGANSLYKKASLKNAPNLKAHANGNNKCQQLPTILGVFGQQCCVRLHGPKSLTGFKLYATSANKCQHCCGSMQTNVTSHNIVGPNNVGCCWPTMFGPFAWALRTY